MITQGPKQRYATFYGPMTLPHSNNLRLMLNSAVNEGAEKITLLFASPGGSTDDGMALFSFLQALPIELTMHAVGVVSSIAIPVFLAAPLRFASSHSRFYFHDATWTYPSPIVTRTMANESALLMENALDWMREIMKAKTKLQDSDIEKKRLLKEPYIMAPSEAAEKGVVQRVCEPQIRAESLPFVVS